MRSGASHCWTVETLLLRRGWGRGSLATRGGVGGELISGRGVGVGNAEAELESNAGQRELSSANVKLRSTLKHVSVATEVVTGSRKCFLPVSFTAKVFMAANRT